MQRQTLLKLRRKYSKDEKISIILQLLEDSNIEKGKLLSELQEREYDLRRIKIKNKDLLHQISGKNKEIEKRNKRICELRNSIEQNEIIKSLREKIKALTNEKRRVQNKYLSLINQK